MAHILVIDDDSDILYILTELLTGEHHTVAVASDGKAGIALVVGQKFDLVITDMVMPEMDGIEVISAIRERAPEVRIIVLTGGTSKLNKEYLMAMGKAMHANKVIAKPINFKELKEAVHDVLTT